jgi:Na+/H+ antiporter NhaD/arsenite permease-like protein
LLAVLIGTSAVLSSLLTNDVVVVAMTPLLVAATLSRGLNPVPFLLGFCFAANTGSVATIIGSPQNMIVAQGLHLSFVGFAAVTLVPALLSLPIVWSALALLYRRRWRLTAAPAPAGGSARVAVNHWETAKAAVVAFAVVAAFVVTDWPREQIALGAAGVLLLNRTISSTDILKHVDGDLILLLIGLFVVNAALAETGLPQRLLADMDAHGIELRNPLGLFAVSAALSNIVGNNPAVMLLVPYVAGAEPVAAGAALALGTGFSSNLVVFGSLAGIIVVEAAARQGIRISFCEFSRAGGCVALATMALAAAWILVLG